MVLLAHTQTLVLKLLHHTVEDVHDTVGLILSHLTEPTAEILFAQQLHTASYRVHRLDNLTVEHHQIDKYKRFAFCLPGISTLHPARTKTIQE